MRPNKLAVISILALVVFVLAMEGLLGASTTQQTDSSPSCHVERTATVNYVVDGDTICLEGGEKVRMVGVNTPEIHPTVEPGGLEAKEFVESICLHGTEIGLNVDGLTPKDKYGRTLAIVYVNVDNSWMALNTELLWRGLAEVLYIPPSEFNPYGWLD
jgi:micrococcal nuclease